MAAAGLPPPVSTLGAEELVSEADQQLLLDFFRVLNSDWTLQESEEANNFKVYYQYSDESPIVMIKGEATVNTSVSNLLDFLHSYGDTFDSNMQVLDAMCTGAQAVDVLDAKHKVNYATFRVPKPASDRDFLWSNFSTMLANGDAVCIGRSTAREDYPPDTSLLGYVRGQILASGYYCEHFKSDREKCVLHFVVQADPCGWLPTWAINLSAKDQAHNARRAAEHFGGGGALRKK